MIPAEEGVKAITSALASGWNAHDSAAFAAAFRIDANFTNVFGIELLGREAIARGHAQIFAGMFRDSTLRLDTPKVTPLGEGLAWVGAHWQMSGAYDPQGAPWPDRRGVMHFVAAADDDGVWQIAAFTNMDLPPASQVAASREQLTRGSQP
jgi:uncharacterized protein (TIGR02246 family)